MSLSRFELYHGAVLSQIIRNERASIKLVEKEGDQDWSAYEVSDNKRDYAIYVKSTDKITKSRGGERRANFTFSSNDVKSILAHSKEKEIMICLVCSDQEICTLLQDDIKELSFNDEVDSHGVSVSWSKGSGLEVKSNKKSLPRKIPRARLKNYEWR